LPLRQLQKKNMLSLNPMQKGSVPLRQVCAKVPPRAEYSLTELGESLKPILDAMQSWEEAYSNLAQRQAFPFFCRNAGKGCSHHAGQPGAYLTYRFFKIARNPE